MRTLMVLWRTLSRPSKHFALGFLTFGGFIAGIIFWGGFNTALEITNTERFCVYCHEMRDNVFAELKATIHYTNRSGVRATCPDCHVPHEWTNKIARKTAATKELWGKIFATISTTNRPAEPPKLAAQMKTTKPSVYTRFRPTMSESRPIGMRVTLVLRT